MGSASELRYHFLLARDLGYLPSGDFARLDISIRRVEQLLSAFLQHIRPKRLTEDCVPFRS